MNDTEIEELDIDDLTLTGEQYLLFNVSNDTYAIPVTQIREIIEYTEPTTVPMAPDFISGIINLRGGAVPVINLANKFKQNPQEITKRTCIIITEITTNNNGSSILGCLVDKVQQVRDIPEDAIEPPPQFGSLIDTRFIKNMAKINDHFIIILEIDNVLSMEELEMVEMIQEKPSDD